MDIPAAGTGTRHLLFCYGTLQLPAVQTGLVPSEDPPPTRWWGWC